MEKIKIFFKYSGIHIFILSCIIYSQINWAIKSQIFNDLWLRIVIGLVFAVLLSFGLIYLISWIGKKRGFDVSRLLIKLSLILFPGILLVLAPLNSSFYLITLSLCLSIYMILWLHSKFRYLWLFPVSMALLLGVTFFLRTWGIDYNADHPDGGKQISAAAIFIQGDYSHGLDDGNRFIRGYPFFTMHILEWVYFGYEAAYRHFAPITTSPGDRPLALLKAFLTILQRWLNTIYQLISVLLLYFIGRKLFDKWIGIVSGAALAISSVNIQMSHVVNADISSLLFVLASMAVAVTLLEKETLLRYFCSGVFAGLAAASKYHGLFSLLFVFLVFFDIRFRKRDFLKAPFQKLFIASCVAGGTLIAFSLATPTLFINAEKAVDSMLSAGNLSHNARIPEEYISRHLAYYFYLLPVHINSFLRYFEPIP
ncbi:MAG: glycosyltransferase family 39 protein, partial [Candidatus Theseobacter exili]|nr:glycosyltransferase family 39 protein [Candidatus Theseobacter exili]